MVRARRPAAVAAVIENAGDGEADLRPRLVLPKGVRMVGNDLHSTVRIERHSEKRLVWQIEADEAAQCELGLQIAMEDQAVATASLSMLVLPAVKIEKRPYIPEPQPVKTPILIGAHHCPLWEADKPHMWDNILKHPERTAALGFYSQENPEVSDWETKWAVEHGIAFFMLLLDNWNEWGEGHYLAPYREYGFGYLDAVREVCCEDSGPHVDLIPEDIGMGPYDTAYKAHQQREKKAGMKR